LEAHVTRFDIKRQKTIADLSTLPYFLIFGNVISFKIKTNEKRMKKERQKESEERRNRHRNIDYDKGERSGKDRWRYK
jgi:hypothetical protein